MGDKVGNLKTIDEADMFDPIPLVWGLERSQTGYLIDGKKSFRALDVKVGNAPTPCPLPSKRDSSCKTKHLPCKIHSSLRDGSNVCGDHF
jgi:hypothetical protein